MRAHYVLICAFMALAIFSCEDNPAIDVDPKFRPDNIIDAEMYITEEGDTISNIPTDVIQFSSYNFLMLGKHKDPKHGEIKAGFTSELSLGRRPYKALWDVDTIGGVAVDTVEFVSSEFRIHYQDKSWLGDTAHWSKMTVYELTERLSPDASYTSDFDPTLYNPVQIGELEYKVSNNVPDSVWKTTNYVTRLSVPIDDEVGSKIFEADSATITNEEAFRDLFNGVYVTTENLNDNEGALLRLNYRELNQELAIIYRLKKTIRDYIDQNDSIAYDTIVKTFPINQEGAKALTYKRSFDNSEIDFDDDKPEKVYLQGMKGAMAKFTISDDFINHWKEVLPKPGEESDDLITSIASVELSLFEDLDKEVEGYANRFPSNLSVYIKNSNGDFVIPRFDRSQTDIGAVAISSARASAVDSLRIKYTFSFATGFFEEFIHPTLPINEERNFKELYIGISNPDFSLNQAVINSFKKDESNITVRYVEVK